MNEERDGLGRSAADKMARYGFEDAPPPPPPSATGGRSGKIPADFLLQVGCGGEGGCIRPPEIPPWVNSMNVLAALVLLHRGRKGLTVDEFANYKMTGRNGQERPISNHNLRSRVSQINSRTGAIITCAEWDGKIRYSRYFVSKDKWNALVTWCDRELERQEKNGG